MKKKIIILFSAILLTGVFFFIFNKPFSQRVKNIFDEDQKIFLKKYFLPYKFISQQNDKILDQEKTILKHNELLKEYKDRVNLHQLEIDFQKSFKNLETKDKNTLKLNDKLTISKYTFKDGFYAGINNVVPGSGYIDFYGENLVLVSARGTIASGRVFDDNFSLKQIRSNISEFYNLDKFKYDLGRKYKSIKDLHIFNNRIYISYIENVKPNDCLATSIIYGDFNFNFIEFKKISYSNECVNRVYKIGDKNGDFHISQSGGRIASSNRDKIFLTVGDYRVRHLAQDSKSIFGKIIEINLIDNTFDIISSGHRNSQGMLFDKENNFLLVSEHGPLGGDEINLIDLNDKSQAKNYGWPVSSYGAHYGAEWRYEFYPLHKSHRDHGFIEPLKYFNPSIAPSEIVKVKENLFVLSSMKDQSIYFFQLDSNKQIKNFERVFVDERIRDLSYKNGKLFLFLEDSASIGIISIPDTY